MNVAALRSDQFRRYLAGNAFALNALWMLRVAVGWVAWDISGSASFVGAVAFLYFAPTMVAGPLFGVMTDRVDIKRAAIATQSTLMALSFSLALLYVTDHLSEPTILAYATLAGLTMAAHAPVRMSLAPRLVDRDSIGSAVNLVAINFNIARMSGPAIAGLLIAQFGVFSCLVLTTLFYIPFILALTTLSPRVRERRTSEKLRFGEALREGFGYAARDKVIRGALFIVAMSSFFLRGLLEVLPILADGVFGQGASGLGLLTSAAGIGAILGGLGLTALTQRSGGTVPTWIALFYLLGLAGLLAIGLTETWMVAIGLVVGLGLVTTIVSIVCQSAIQMQLDDALRGRVMSIWAVVAIGSAALGSLVFGALDEVYSFQTTAITMAISGFSMLLIWVGFHHRAPS